MPGSQGQKEDHFQVSWVQLQGSCEEVQKILNTLYRILRWMNLRAFKVWRHPFYTGCCCLEKWRTLIWKKRQIFTDVGGVLSASRIFVAGTVSFLRSYSSEQFIISISRVTAVLPGKKWKEIPHIIINMWKCIGKYYKCQSGPRYNKKGSTG